MALLFSMTFLVHEMALFVEALNTLLNSIWPLLEVGRLRLNLHDFDSIFSSLEMLHNKISAVLRFHVAVQPIKNVFGSTD